MFTTQKRYYISGGPKCLSVNNLHCTFITSKDANVFQLVLKFRRRGNMMQARYDPNPYLQPPQLTPASIFTYKKTPKKLVYCLMTKAICVLIKAMTQVQHRRRCYHRRRCSNYMNVCWKMTYYPCDAMKKKCINIPPS